jgi:hypothetical protein
MKTSDRTVDDWARLLYEADKRHPGEAPWEQRNEETRDCYRVYGRAIVEALGAADDTDRAALELGRRAMGGGAGYSGVAALRTALRALVDELPICETCFNVAVDGQTVPHAVYGYTSHEPVWCEEHAEHRGRPANWKDALATARKLLATDDAAKAGEGTVGK